MLRLGSGGGEGGEGYLYHCICNHGLSGPDERKLEDDGTRTDDLIARLEENKNRWSKKEEKKKKCKSNVRTREMIDERAERSEKSVLCRVRVWVKRIAGGDKGLRQVPSHCSSLGRDALSLFVHLCLSNSQVRY